MQFFDWIFSSPRDDISQLLEKCLKCEITRRIDKIESHYCLSQDEIKHKSVSVANISKNNEEQFNLYVYEGECDKELFKMLESIYVEYKPSKLSWTGRKIPYPLLKSRAVEYLKEFDDPIEHIAKDSCRTLLLVVNLIDLTITQQDVMNGRFAQTNITYTSEEEAKLRENPYYEIAYIVFKHIVKTYSAENNDSSSLRIEKQFIQGLLCNKYEYNPDVIFSHVSYHCLCESETRVNMQLILTSEDVKTFGTFLNKYSDKFVLNKSN